MNHIAQIIAGELSVKSSQVESAITLLDKGATVPFISRYRKEVTGGLDDTQLRTLDERLVYLRELNERRTAILKSIAEQDKLTPELKKQIEQAETKTVLEDLYLPYKPKRRTKAQIAKEAGLEPLADMLLQDPTLDPEQQAAAFLNAEHKIESAKDALDGAKQILMERFSEDAVLLEQLRAFQKREAYLHATVMTGKESEGQKFADYFDHKERYVSVPSHRALAMFRGRNEGVLSIQFTLEEELELGQAHPAEVLVAEHLRLEDRGRTADKWLAEVVKWTWRVKLATRIETDLLSELRDRAEADAIDVFAANMKDVLLAAPAGQKVTIGLDPGLRTGVKVAVVDATGKVLDHGAIFPNPPQNRVRDAEAMVLGLIKKYGVELIAIGNGTASRETDKFVGDLIKTYKLSSVKKVMVNESGASVYSASEFAAREFPDLDVTIRGAISIARRLQDPLAELVKIDPKSIGVGQYQHDVSQLRLAKSLDAVVEDCVNGVGVELNTASEPLLARVSGLNQTIANNIVAFRNENGAFKNRDQLKKVARLGPKAFEQCAGFLRISDGENPLDASGVHPEAYEIVSTISKNSDKHITSLIGNAALLKSLNPKDFVSEQFGLPTIIDIISELDKPGRDPRPEFKTASFKENIEEIKDLELGMVLEGTITNVTNFGAFVDVGVHQDGLVHISALSNTFVKDPRDVVKAGEIVSVKVMDVDIARKRIALSMRLDDAPVEKSDDGQRVKLPNNRKTRLANNDKRNDKKKTNKPRRQQHAQPEPSGTMAALFKEAMQKKK